MTESTAVEHVSTAASPALKSAEEQHLNMLWKLARMTTDTEMVPKVLRGRPDAALAVMVYGHELSLRPMTALREVFIIEGTPSCSAKLMRALIYRAGHKLHFKEQSRERVTVYGERSDGLGSATVTWELEDAKQAGLLAKDVWKRYPRQMLSARATSELARLIFADTTIGYTPEELSRVDLGESYDYVDVEEDPELGDDPQERRSAAQQAVDILDVDDALDAAWLAEAGRSERDDDDEVAARAEGVDRAEEGS